MVVHRRKKSKKKSFRRKGERRRGAGNRGGRGRAGFGKRAKHRKLLAMKLGLLPGSERGFTSIKKKEKIITLEEINEMAWELKRKNKELRIDVTKLGFEKVVGRGKLRFPVIILAKHFTEGALKKIEEVGGKAVRVY